MAQSKKRKYETLEDLLERVWCYYCEKDFVDLLQLVDHQRKMHFHCPHCNRRLNSANGLVVHVANVHKETVDKVANVPRELSGRESTKVEVFAMEGIPEELLQRKRQQIIVKYKEKEAEYLRRTGNPLPGSAEHLARLAAAAENRDKGTKSREAESELGSIKARVEARKRAAAERRAQQANQANNEANGAVAPTAESPKSEAMKDPAASPSTALQDNNISDNAHAASDLPGSASVNPSMPPSYGQPGYGFPSIPTSSVYPVPQPPYATMHESYNPAYQYPMSQPGYGAPPPTSYVTSPPAYGQPQMPYGATPPPTFGGPQMPYGFSPPPYAAESANPNPGNGYGAPRPRAPPRGSREARTTTLPAAHGLPQRPSFDAPNLGREEMDSLHSAGQMTTAELKESVTSGSNLLRPELRGPNYKMTRGEEYNGSVRITPSLTPPDRQTGSAIPPNERKPSTQDDIDRFIEELTSRNPEAPSDSAFTSTTASVSTTVPVSTPAAVSTPAPVPTSAPALESNMEEPKPKKKKTKTAHRTEYKLDNKYFLAGSNTPEETRYEQMDFS